MPESGTKLRILFAHQYLGSFAGAETNIELTARELAARGHQIGLLYSQRTGKRESIWTEIFPEVYSMATTGVGRDGEEIDDQIKACLKQFRPDLVYLHTFPDISVARSFAESGLPVVKMVHDHQLYCLRSYKYHPITRQVCTRPASAACIFPCLAMVARNREGGWPLKWASYSEKQRELEVHRQFHHFVVYSDYCRQELVRNGFPAAKISLHVPIHCWGVEGPVSSFSDRNLLVFAGQVIRGKGVDALLRALACVKNRFECVILGEGNHRKYCERLSARLGLADRVRFAGYVPPEELKSYYLQATAFLMSSLWPEPFGMAGPEAMRYGLPVVAFDSGGISEWLIDGENGFRAPWSDIGAYARRVDQLLGDKSLARELGRRGQERVNRLYDSRRQVANLERIFLDVLGRVTGGHVPSAESVSPMKGFSVPAAV